MIFTPRMLRYDAAVVKLAPVIQGGEWLSEPTPGVPPPPQPIMIAKYRPFIREDGLKLAMIGCPHGGPLKYTSGRMVDIPETKYILDPLSGDGNPLFRGPTTGPYFKHNLETFRGKH